jgi:hypothetical protein
MTSNLLHLIPAAVCMTTALFFNVSLLADMKAKIASTRDIANVSALSVLSWAGAAVSLWEAVS